VAFNFNSVYFLRYNDAPIEVVLGVRQRQIGLQGSETYPHIEFLVASLSPHNWHQVLGEVIEDSPDRVVVRQIQGYYDFPPDPDAVLVFEPLTRELWTSLGLRRDEVFQSDDELQAYYREAYMPDWWTADGPAP
jgi:hypothetical protein